jgi:DNA-directed RNA polymerase subunit omega
MPERRSALTEPRLEHLLERVGSKFSLVALSARRARDINDYYNQLGEGLGRLVPPQVTSVSRKPLSIALEEIDAGKIVPVEGEVGDREGVDGAGSEGQAVAGEAPGPAVATEEPPPPGA